jgi:thioredoxin 1
MSEHTIEITSENFETTVDNHPIVILDFWAEWCAPCRAFAPVFEQVASTHQDVVFGKVNTETAKDLAGAFQVRSIPTLMAFRDGILLFEQAGAVPAEMLVELVEKIKALDMNVVREQMEKHAAEHEHGPGCNHDHKKE